MSKRFKAGDTFPSLTLQKVNQSVSDIAKPEQDNDWRLVLFYRGKHCPLCTKYLKAIEEKKQQLYDIKVDVIAVSGDSLQQAQEHLEEMGISFPVAYGLSEEQMEQLGLYISTPRSSEETDHNFCEPGTFVINSDGKVQIVDVSNAPFSRPDIDDLISGIKFIRENDYPIRGTHN